MLKILQRAQEDAARMRQCARIVLEINGEGFQVFRNEDPKINVIVVIGSNSQTYGQEVVLEEIGLWRTRPFSEGKLARSKLSGDGVRYVAPRIDAFHLAPEQYDLVAPEIFKILQEMVDLQTSQWKCGTHNPFCVWSSRSRYSQKGRKLYKGKRLVGLLQGLRFSVRSTSAFFLSDLYWAELNLNSALKFYLEGLAKFIDLRLSKYKQIWKGKVEFRNLKGVREVGEIIYEKNLPRYLLSEMMSYLPGRTGNGFWWHLCDLLGLHGYESVEKKVSSKVLSDPQKRLGKIQLRIVTGIAKAKKNVVFEIFPNETGDK
ncbi:MAG: hypothetical protein WC726_02440 [Parcubacteria group bacterium]